jgi:hypothetical protein
MPRVFSLSLLSLLVAMLIASGASGFVSKKEEGERLGMEVRGRILSSHYHSKSDLALWRQLVHGQGISPVERIGAGLALVDRLFPGGDPSMWSSVSGLMEEEVPRSLVAADAVLYTAYLAYEALPEPEGAWLAYILMKPFFSSSEARLTFGRICPEPLAELMDRMSRDGVEPPEGWPEPFRVVGYFPMAHPVSGSVAMDQVLLYGMERLDNQGRPSEQGNAYAWDREAGVLYRISR